MTSWCGKETDFYVRARTQHDFILHINAFTSFLFDYKVTMISYYAIFSLGNYKKYTSNSYSLIKLDILFLESGHN